MALEGTHFRYALDVKDKFKVTELKPYISGCVYPDSRYQTGIDRILTHSNEQMSRNFWKDDDFKKGWATHLLYDKIMYSVHVEWFERLMPSGSNEWSWFTALKIFQDIDDVKKFDITEYIECLNFVGTPNGEDVSEVRAYNELIESVYRSPTNLSIESYSPIWQEWNLPKERISMLKSDFKYIEDLTEIGEKVLEVYDETLKRTEDWFNEFCL